MESSQNNEETDWKYLGQTPPGDTPKVFAPGIVSTKSLEHSSPTFSPDGTEIYWSKIDFPLEENKNVIMHMKYKNGKWSEPEPVWFNGKAETGIPFYSYDGQKIYFGSGRRKVEKPEGADANMILVWGSNDPEDNP